MKSTRWSPDTCGCAVTFTWDDSANEEKRVHAFDRAETVCAEHEGLAPEDVYEAILAENQSKNRALGQIAAQFPNQTVTTIQPDGTLGEAWKPGCEPSWDFGKPDATGVRALVLTTPGLSKTERLLLDEALVARADIPAVTRAP